jgi:hypothetical protein
MDNNLRGQDHPARQSKIIIHSNLIAADADVGPLTCALHVHALPPHNRVLEFLERHLLFGDDLFFKSNYLG